MDKIEKKWISDFLGVGYRYTDIVMNVLILYHDRKNAIKVWNEYIHWWPDDQIVLRFIEDRDYYWFILYQRGKNLYSKENVGFFKRNQLTQNYLRFKKNFDQKTILRFALYKSMENKNSEKNMIETNENIDKRNNPGFELNIFKRLKTVYDVKFQTKSELDTDSVEYSLIKNQGSKYA
ncbi:MAG TPA: hypothetical protein VJ599_03795 [Nitrososphaeraceae archaeon]|nr:hypothetical protein [Nitrososphaeraceae archaeon]